MNRKKNIYLMQSVFMNCILIPFLCGCNNGQGKKSEEISNKEVGWGIIDTQGQFVISCQYDDICSEKEERIAVKKNGKWGFINVKGDTIVPFIYDNVGSFSEGLAYVRTKIESEANTRYGYGYIDKYGKIVIPITHNLSFDFSEGLVDVYKNGKLGFMNTQGLIVIPCIYDELESGEFFTSSYTFKDGFAFVKKEGKYGLIDFLNNIKLPFEYDKMERVSINLIKVEKKGKKGLVTNTGMILLPCKYNEISTFKHGIASIKYDEDYFDDIPEAYSIIDEKGNFILPWTTEFYYQVTDDGYIKAMKAGKEYLLPSSPAYNHPKYGLLDRNGNWLVPCLYGDIGASTGTLTCVKEWNKSRKEYKWGVRTNIGEMALRSIYDECKIINNNSFMVKEGASWSIVDTNSIKTNGLEYSFIDNFSCGLARVQRNGKWGYINGEGLEVVECLYKMCYSFHNGYALVER